MIKKKLILLCIVLLITPLVYADNYGAGVYGAGVYGGEVVSPPENGNGNGAAVCTYDWVCTNWFPAECPESEVQERVCANKGTCTGTVGMPNQTRTCVYEGLREPLFDIFLIISEQYKEICAGQRIKAKVSLVNLGKIEPLDAFMTYWVIDENNTLIAELKDTRKVKDKETFNVGIKIPTSVPEGTYRLYAQIAYENKTAVAGESFEIIGGKYCEIYSVITKYSYFILIGIISLMIVILIILLIRRIKKNKRLKQVMEYKGAVK